MRKSPFYNSDEVKSFDFSPWGGIDGFLSATSNGANAANKAMTLKRLVPDLSRAIDLTAVCVASLPFDIIDIETGEIYDSSYEWTNKVGGMNNPQRLLYLLASSLCGGAAYVIPQRTPRYIYELQYAAPHTITPQIRVNGLEYFDRVTDTGKVERYNPKDIIYFWLPDSDIEIGAAMNTPLGNAMQDAELTLNIKNTMRIYGERGFVPITLLGAKNMPNEIERQKAEGFFDRLLKGGFNVLAKIVNSEALTLIKVGAGMEELKGAYIEVLRQSKEDIAQAFGIPTALFMSDNAFASEMDALRKQFYQSSRFKSIYMTIEETFTEQLLKPYKKAMYFRPEGLDIFQEDEAARAGSLSSIVSSINTNPRVARFTMEVLGYDLTEEQEDELNSIIEDAEPEEVPEQLQQPVVEDTVEEMPEEEVEVLSPDEVKDIALWYSKARAWHIKGKGNAVDWECKFLREEIASKIRMKLADAKNELDIVKAFEITETQKKSDVIILAQAINRLADEA